MSKKVVPSLYTQALNAITKLETQVESGPGSWLYMIGPKHNVFILGFRLIGAIIA